MSKYSIACGAGDLLNNNIVEKSSSNQLSYWLTLYNAYCKGPLIKHLLTIFNSAENICKAPAPDLLAAGVKILQIKALKEPDLYLIDTEMRWGLENQHNILSWDHPAFPEWLKSIYDPPLVLFTKGKVEALNHRQIALVGSRNPTHPGKEIAYSWAHELAKAGITVVSGLAIGIDGAAHQGALSAKGFTVAVLGSGLEFIYPTRHIPLAEEIMENGVLASEFSPRTRPLAQNFPQRNRIISGLSLGVCVIEAAPGSGSLITAKMAAEQGREVFAVPGSIQNPLAKGCNALIQEGAKLVMHVSDILNELQHFRSDCSIIKDQFIPMPLDSSMKQLLECVDYHVTTVDQIQVRSKKPIEQVIALMTDLELQGCVYATAGGYVRRV